VSIAYSSEIIPTEEEEKPVHGYAGFTFKNVATHCRVKHLFPPKPDEQVPEQWTNAMTLYLANFCEPVRNLANEVHCVACNAKLTGPYGMEDWRTRNAIKLDTTSPTLEGRCNNCGYPMRCQHDIKLPTGETLVKLAGFPLMYHPINLEGRLKLG
jgi:hypothetical protein